MSRIPKRIEPQYPNPGTVMSVILLVDDEQALRQCTAFVLRSHGFGVAERGDGLSALRLAEEQPFDVVVTDILMPEDGLQLIRGLKRLEQRPKIIAVSGGAEWFGVEDCLATASRLGADRVLRKPFDPNELIKTIDELTSDEASPC